MGFDFERCDHYRCNIGRIDENEYFTTFFYMLYRFSYDATWDNDMLTGIFVLIVCFVISIYITMSGSNVLHFIWTLPPPSSKTSSHLETTTPMFWAKAKPYSESWTMVQLC